MEPVSSGTVSDARGSESGSESLALQRAGHFEDPSAVGCRYSQGP